MRRQFSLPSGDVDYLDSLGLDWETVKDGNSRRVIIRGYPVAPGYNVSTAAVSLVIEQAYPDTQIDMAHFNPALQRADGIPISKVTVNSFAGEQWQQWSRHRTGVNPWRPGIDDLESHMLLVEIWLIAELQKGKA